MARSLSLAAYLAYARRAPHAAFQPSLPRPDGHVIWGHALDAPHVNALTQLGQRLSYLRPGLHMLLTTSADLNTDRGVSESLLHQTLPEDTVATAEQFLAHWQPALCLWTGGELQPAILSCAAKQGVVLYLVDAEEDQVTRPGWRWFPDLPRSVLSRFERIMARSEDTARFLRRLGVDSRRVTVSGPFLEGSNPLNYNEPDREELSGLLRSRPVWLAARLQPEETRTVLDAHRAISKLAHRALLIIAPEDPGKVDGVRRALDQDGWRFVTWSKAEMPDEGTQVILADTPDELGLWYRVAPVTFMGSSLFSGPGGRDPNEPAAHGSAILYGPNIRSFLNSYSRFAEAGGARIVRDTNTLAAAVQRLIQPDQAAAMAHAAWDVASRSADVADTVTDLVLDRLDQMEAG